MRWYFALLLTLGLLAATIANDDFDDDSVVVSDEVDEPQIQETEPQTVNYQSPYATPGKFYFADHFDDLDTFVKKWIKSQAKKEDIAEDIAKYDGVWSVEAPQRQILKGDLGLVLKTKAKHAAISARLHKPFVFNDKPFIIQYEVTLQDGQECGGSYIKLLSSGKETTDLTEFHDKTPYTIMFGPDKCGNDIKLHFIFRHTNPLNGSITEKHCRKPKDRLEEPFKDKQPHLYQLEINPDNSFTVRVDHKIINKGSLLSDFSPPVNPPKEIDDPTDEKPTNWDEREKIPDPDASKPIDWDEDAPPQIPDTNAVKPDGWLDNEEEMIPDPNAMKPEDWDSEMDGEWEAPLIANPICEKAVGCGLWKAPLISNPNYKGKWRAPLIDNPNYQGKWAPRKIPNPEFFEDLNPFKMTTIAAVGIELWSMSSDILFDNLIITDDIAMAAEWAAQTYDLKRRQLDRDSVTLWDRAMKYMNYKPGWWAMYFIYCLIPICLYVWYLSRRISEEETLVTRLVNYTNDNPWMWAVYVIVIGLPLAIAIFFLCSSKDKPDVLHPKKTDEPIPDDNLNEETYTESKNTKSKKSDLDEPQATTAPKTATLSSEVDEDGAVGGERDDGEEEEDEDEEEEEDEEQDEVEDAEEEVDILETKDVEIEKEIENVEPTITGTRKRKPRKD